MGSAEWILIQDKQVTTSIRLQLIPETMIGQPFGQVNPGSACRTLPVRTSLVLIAIRLEGGKCLE